MATEACVVGQVVNIGPDDEGPAQNARYAATRSPDRAFAIRARVRSTPKIATKEPKRGPWL